MRLFSATTLAFPGFDGCYLPKQESQFVHKVLDDLDAFHQRADQKSVLLFPPLPSRLRFLIHKAAEKLPELSTFSVGEGWSRRVAACYSSFRSAVGECGSDTDASSCDGSSTSSREMEVKPRPLPSRGNRRPDKAVYVPRALRNTQRPESSLDSSSCSPSLSVSEESDSTEPPHADHARGADGPDGSIAEQDVLTAGAEPPDWDQTVTCFMGMSLEDGSSKCNTQTKSLGQDQEETDDFYHEITSHLKEAPAVIDHAQNDYSDLENVWIDHDEFSHVIEIYDFPSVFKTDDLLDAFADYSDGGMKIKWVDNTHALAVFSSASAALQALSIKHPLLKTRTLSQGSKKAKGKAARRAEFLQPVRERPRTDTAVARRMVTRALGLRSKRY
ncbi:R3H and coiled-coil domain-containing protein 1 [Trichomycterus rosablanca]|uniref:R3H and coiled-coil domain-containing protein 1 n=1 Tax=Trichomycterus rosablanca TaxID=2290929 RepID=UPI002F3505A5